MQNTMVKEMSGKESGGKMKGERKTEENYTKNGEKGIKITSL